MLALAFGARLELFVCYVPRNTAEVRLDELKLEKLANELREQGIETTVDEACDTTLDTGIVRKVLRSRPSLVVKDTHPHSLLRRWVLANTDWQLIRTCPAPLLFVRQREWRQPPKFAAAVDIALPGEKPAALDHLLLSAAESFSLAMKGALHAVHVYSPVTVNVAIATAALVPMAAGLDPARIAADGELLAREQFEELLSTHTVPHQNQHLLAGRPAEALLEFVGESAIDLLVMGAYARGAMYNVLVGSTTERVLDLLPCDVLVMKPASFECSLNATTEPDVISSPRATG